MILYDLIECSNLGIDDEQLVRLYVFDIENDEYKEVYFDRVMEIPLILLRLNFDGLFISNDEPDIYHIAVAVDDEE